LNSFKFLSDSGSIGTIAFIAIIFTALPVSIYFILESFKLDKTKRVIISSVFQVMITTSILFVLI
jgi:hypothetical protein